MKWGLRYAFRYGQRHTSQSEKQWAHVKRIERI